MGQFDEQYNELIKDVYNNGYSNKGEEVRARWEDGTPAYTKSLIGKTFRFDNSEFPILTTKQVFWKSALAELFWIWQMKSNRVQDLRNLNMTFNGGKNKSIWDSWENNMGSIGLAYGYQLGVLLRDNFVKTPFGQVNIRVDQVDKLLYDLKNNPYSRRHLTEIWVPKDLDRMELTPCVHLTQWHVKGGKLHLEVRARSQDLAIGTPFNVTQYNLLQRMIAQVTGYELGEYIFHMGDVHVYDRHVDTLLKQVDSQQYFVPELKINPDVKDFYDFVLDDFELINYNHNGYFQYEVAI